MPATKTATTDPVAPTPTDLKALRAEAKRLAEAIRVAQANQPSQLEHESARPINKVLPWALGSMLKRRVAAGQPREDATTAVLEQCKALLDATPLRKPDDATANALTLSQAAVRVPNPAAAES